MRVVLMMIWIFLLGCRTTKSVLKGKEDITRQVAQEMLATKLAREERNVLTYWPDGSLYQFEQRKLDVDESLLASMTVKERQKVSQTATVKEQYPWEVWRYPVLAIGLMLLVWVYWKFKK